MRNRRMLPIALAVTGALTLVPFARAGQYGQSGQTGQNQQQSAMQEQPDSTQLRGARDFQGMPVQDRQGKEIGTVDMLVVDPQQGKMAYVILSPAEGTEQVIVPWNAVQVQPPATGAQQGPAVLIVDVPQDQLENAPKGGLPAAADRDQERRIHQFYGVSPYWEEGQRAGEQPQQAPELPPGHPPVLPEDHPPVLPPDHPPVTPSQD